MITRPIFFITRNKILSDTFHFPFSPAMAYLALFLLAAAPTALAGLTEIWWNLTYVNNTNPDGLFSRTVVGVNGSWPPPPIDVSANDTLLLHVENSLEKHMTVHHHGMFFTNASWYDGAVGVSQWSVQLSFFLNGRVCGRIFVQVELERVLDAKRRSTCLYGRETRLEGLDAP